MFSYVSQSTSSLTPGFILSAATQAGMPICMHTRMGNMVSLITLSDLAADKGQEEPIIYLAAYHVTDSVTGNEY